MTNHLELDVSPELGLKEAASCQSLIGIFSWMVKLGCVDICLKVSMKSSHLALPWKGHLDQVLHIFGYLQKYHNTELVYDPSDPVIEESNFTLQDWSSSKFGHVQGHEEKPPNMLETRGLGYTMRSKVNADHAADMVTRTSRNGFLVDINSALVYWWSMKQTTVKSSSFGSEFITIKQCCEYIQGLQYNLRMMGYPL